MDFLFSPKLPLLWNFSREIMSHYTQSAINVNLGAILDSSFFAHPPHVIGKVMQILTSLNVSQNDSLLSDHIAFVRSPPLRQLQSPGVDLLVPHLECHSRISSVSFHWRHASWSCTWLGYPTAYNFFSSWPTNILVYIFNISLILESLDGPVG